MKGDALSVATVARKEGFDCVYHLLHMANLRSVLAQGLLSRSEIDARGMSISSLQSESVRSARTTPLNLPNGSAVPLDHYLSLNWFPSTPVLANLAYDWREAEYSQRNQEFLVLLEVDVAALDSATELWFATASPLGRECSLVSRDEFGHIPWQRLRTARDRHGDFSDGIAGSEVLVGGVIPPSFLRGCAVCSETTADRVRALGIDLPLAVRPDWFFGF